MYDRAPGKAMHGYAGYHDTPRPEWQGILLAEREISNTIWKQDIGLLGRHKAEPSAVAELEKLSRHKEWWVRLYVVAIMREHRAFRQPDIIERLKTDAHPLVRKGMCDEGA